MIDRLIEILNAWTSTKLFMTVLRWRWLLYIIVLFLIFWAGIGYGIIQFAITWLGEWFEPFLEPLFNFLIQPSVASGLAVIIGVFGLCVLFYLFIHWLLIYVYVIKPLREETSKIEGEKSFLDNFDPINKTLNNSKVKHVWQEFKETLIHPDQEESLNDNEDETRRIRNTVRPAEYFYPAAFNAELNFYRVWPNIFVGIGLVLTFAGIISALSEVLSGFSANTPAGEIQASLERLLNATAVKFYASMVGLFFSIVISMFVRGYSRWIRSAFDATCQNLERGLRSTNPDELATKQLSELSKQTTQLEKFSTELAMEIGREVGKEVKKAIGEGAEAVVKDVADDTFQIMREELEKLTKALGGLAGNLTLGSKEFQQTIQNSQKQLGTALADAGKNFTEDVKKQLAELAKELSKTTQQQIEGLQKNIEKLNTPIQDLQKSLQQGAEGMKEVADVTKSIAEIKPAIAAINEAASKASDGAKNIKEPLEKAIKLWKEHHDRIENTDKKLGEYLQKINDNTIAVISRLNNFVAELDTRFAAAIISLETVIEALADEKQEKKEVKKEGATPKKRKKKDEGSNIN